MSAKKKKSSQSCCYTQQDMGHKILFYKQFIVSIKMQHYSKAAFLHLPLTPGNTSSKREHERRIFHPCIFFLPFTAGLIKRVVSDGGRVCRGVSGGFDGGKRWSCSRLRARSFLRLSAQSAF